MGSLSLSLSLSLSMHDQLNKYPCLHAFVLHREQYHLQGDLRGGAHLTADPHHHEHVVAVLGYRPQAGDDNGGRVGDAEVAQNAAAELPEPAGVRRKWPAAGERQVHPQKGDRLV